jgi:hypothetical protein
MGSAQQPLSDLNIQGEGVFVPVLGVQYLGNPGSSAELESHIIAHWPLRPVGT